MKKIIGLLFLLISFVFPFSVKAETKSVKVEADTFANEAYPEKNYGGVGSVIVGNEPTGRFGYLKFPHPDLPAGAVIDRVVVKINVHEKNYGDKAKLNVGPVKDDWTETGLTWNNKPAIYNEKAIEATINLSFGWQEIEITSIFEHWQKEGNKGLFIYPYGYLYGGSEGDFAFSFRSRESASFGLPEAPAELLVEYHLPSSPSPSPSVSASPSVSPSPKSSPSFSPSASVLADLEATPTATPMASIFENQEKRQNNYWFLAGLGGGALILGAGLLLLWKKNKNKQQNQEKEPAQEE